MNKYMEQLLLSISNKYSIPIEELRNFTGKKVKFRKTVEMITIYTDGSCSPNPGNGGWAFIIAPPHPYGKESYISSGGMHDTTNNIMELTAVIEALKFRNENVTIMTDSNYVKSGITQWIKNWKKNGWQTANKTPVKNKAYWVTLDALVTDGKNIRWEWIQSHNGDEYNEMADKMACAARNAL